MTTIAQLRTAASDARTNKEKVVVLPQVLDQLLDVALWPDTVGHDIPTGNPITARGNQ